MRATKRVVSIVAALVAFGVVAGLSYEQWSRWNMPRTLQPMGELVDVEGRRFHIVCTGSGNPTVILESGLDSWGSLSWTRVQTEIAKITRVCSYDRAGIAWSDRREEPLTADRLADELHALLGAASESPPYVMVGHSLGGMLVRVFADRFDDEVVGFVFVDSGHPEQLERMPPGLVSQADATVWLWRIAAATGVLRLFPAPDEAWLPQESRRTFASFRAPSTRTMLAELRALPQIAARDAASGHLGDRPLVVLTGGRSGEQLPSDLRELADGVRFELQTELAALSRNSDHRVIADARHYIQFDNPEAVTGATVDVVTSVREGALIRSTRHVGAAAP